MSKIVLAVNKMIENIDKASKVIQGEDLASFEIFFLYDRKFKWSIMKVNDDYTLFYYPDSKLTIEYLASLPPQEFHDIKIVSYKSKDIKTIEATESFAELYNLLNNKANGADDVLDEIINS